ncbi:M48 family metalloprotease [Paracrocinitomix mangrovi]|uniref:M48 family metalloprotease n=1 Tax=Paracrocinitomix mangrovi TaxID=2862509 RepID=UPI001EDC56F1|nr:M48 family metalloprotease [Paracrocinitomix mangrovi]UKN00841.1 M48 family metalloprotease [Paracrocinitomix mangrovi]
MSRLLMSILAVGLLVSCGTGKDGKSDVPDGGFNLFPVEKDRELGAQVAKEIASKPAEFPILDSASNVAAYKYIYGVRDKILATGQVKHKDDFLWKIHIIKNDTTLNAFCTPGGYIYFYTGIIKYLENEAQLAGVMGHEMAHADLRHSTRQMTKVFGVQILLAAALGDQSVLGQITTGLLSLKFSRNHETEADHLGVHYLCPTEWQSDGGAGFFEKIMAEGGQTPPEFLSTHPSPDNRVENYHTWAQEEGCSGNATNEAAFRNFQALFD